MKKRHDIGFLLIAALKVVEGVLLLGVGIAALSLLKVDLADAVKQIAQTLQLDLDSRLMQKLIVHAGFVQRKDMELVAGTTIAYAVLLLTEGIGLYYEKLWAEYLTFIITASFIPYEGYKLVAHPTLAKLGLIIINAVVAAYLARRLYQRSLQERKAPVSAAVPAS